MAVAAAPKTRRGRWIEHWEPEDPDFWERTGKKVANRNLWFSVLAEHIGFSIWTLWSVMVLFMGPAYGIDPAGKFLLVAVPTLVGALVRIPYTMAPAKFGGRNWTIFSAVLLLVPSILAAIVMHPGTSYTTFVIVAAIGGIGGGNFASSMVNINAFFPEGKKGWALGLNAGAGNIGVAVVQLVGLLVIAAAGLASPRLVLGVYLPLIVVAAVLAAVKMDNLTAMSNDIGGRWPARGMAASPGDGGEPGGRRRARGTAASAARGAGTTQLAGRERPGGRWRAQLAGRERPGGRWRAQLAGRERPGGRWRAQLAGRERHSAIREAARDAQTWVMSFLYIGTFGSFIGYSFAFGLVLQSQFGRTPLQAASVTFVGPLLGSLIRPLGGWLADRFGGAKVSLLTYLAMAVACGIVLYASSVRSLMIYTCGFVVLFVLSGIGNGSTYKMIPSIFQGKAKVAISAGEPAEVALATARRLSGAVIGIAGAVGALGGLFINLAFRQSFLTTKSGDAAFWSFLAFYAVCVTVTYLVYLRPVPAARPTTRLAYARV